MESLTSTNQTLLGQASTSTTTNTITSSASEEPPYLTVGTDVSAKYKGAFCEAKITNVEKIVKLRVMFKGSSTTHLIDDDQIKPGVELKCGVQCEARHPGRHNQYVSATLIKITDHSKYTVIFDDGDYCVLRRNSLRLKSGRHFAESETLDRLPLTNPEHFGNPVKISDSNLDQKCKHYQKFSPPNNSSEESRSSVTNDNDLKNHQSTTTTPNLEQSNLSDISRPLSGSMAAKQTTPKLSLELERLKDTKIKVELRRQNSNESSTSASSISTSECDSKATVAATTTKRRGPVRSGRKRVSPSRTTLDKQSGQVSSLQNLEQDSIVERSEKNKIQQSCCTTNKVSKTKTKKLRMKKSKQRSTKSKKSTNVQVVVSSKNHDLSESKCYKVAGATSHKDNLNFDRIDIGTRLRVEYGNGKLMKIYEAKVLKIMDCVVQLSHENHILLDEPSIVRNTIKEKRYFVHYLGWNNRYDEWITQDRIVSIVDDCESGNLVQQNQVFLSNGTVNVGSSSNPSVGFNSTGKRRGANLLSRQGIPISSLTSESTLKKASSTKNDKRSDTIKSQNSDENEVAQTVKNDQKETAKLKEHPSEKANDLINIKNNFHSVKSGHYQASVRNPRFSKNIDCNSVTNARARGRTEHANGSVPHGVDKIENLSLAGATGKTRKKRSIDVLEDSNDQNRSHDDTKEEVKSSSESLDDKRSSDHHCEEQNQSIQKDEKKNSTINAKRRRTAQQSIQTTSLQVQPIGGRLTNNSSSSTLESRLLGTHEPSKDSETANTVTDSSSESTQNFSKNNGLISDSCCDSSDSSKSALALSRSSSLVLKSFSSSSISVSSCTSAPTTNSFCMSTTTDSGIAENTLTTPPGSTNDSLDISENKSSSSSSISSLSDCPTTRETSIHLDSKSNKHVSCNNQKEDDGIEISDFKTQSNDISNQPNSTDILDQDSKNVDPIALEISAIDAVQKDATGISSNCLGSSKGVNTKWRPKDYQIGSLCEPIDAQLDCEQKISILEDRLLSLRRIYASIKTKVSRIERRQKRNRLAQAHAQQQNSPR